MITTGFYYDAFAVGESIKWGNTKFKDELVDVCYHKAINSMLNTNQWGEMDRRQLLYAFMKPFWTSNKNNKVNTALDSFLPSLPSDNSYVLRAIKNLCIAYNRPPRREILGDNNKVATKILDEINFNGFMQKVYRALKLNNRLLYRPYIKSIAGEPEIALRYWGAEDYRTMKNDNGEIIELWVLTRDLAPDSIFREVKYDYNFWVYTNERIIKCDVDGKQIPFVINGITQLEMANLYGFIPYLELSLTNNEDCYNETDGSKWELIRGQIECNMLELSIMEMATYLSFPMRGLINFFFENEDEITISPSSVFISEQKDMDFAPPHFIESGSDTSFTSVEELKDKKIKIILKNMGLPVSVIDDDVTLPESGVALNEMRKELIEVRQEDISNLKRIDSKMLKLLLAVLNNDDASPYKTMFNSSYDINIDYQELETPSVFAEQKEKIEYMELNGFISPLDKYISITGDESINSEEKLKKYITKNKELFAQYKESSDETTTDNVGAANTNAEPTINGNGDEFPSTSGEDQIEGQADE